MLRIAFVTDGIFPHAVGGIQRHTAQLAPALGRLGADVTVIAPRGHEEGSEGYAVHTLAWPSHGPYPAQLWEWAGRCARAVAEHPYDVVYGQGLALWGRLRPEGPPSVFNPHGLEFCTIPGAVARAKAAPLRFGARRQAAQATRTISLGGRLTETIERCLGVPRAKIVVLPNAVAAPPPAASFPRDERLVLFVGRLFANKGVDVLCAAVDALPRDVRVVIVGDGPLREPLRAQFPDSRIEFRGGVTEAELENLYRTATVLALPTRSEGMPTVVLEAFRFGLPAVATDVGAVAELVDDSTGALLAAPRADLLAEALSRLLGAGDETRQLLGENARRRVADRFTWDAVADRTLEVLEDVA